MSIERSTFDDYGEIVAPAAPAAGKVRIYAKTGGNSLFAKDSAGVETDLGAAGGPPGTWTQIAKGTTTVADLTTVTLATISGVANGELLWGRASPQDDIDILYHEGDLTSVVTGHGIWSLKKTTTVDEHLFQIEHSISPTGPITWDWVVYRVVPV